MLFIAFTFWFVVAWDGSDKGFRFQIALGAAASSALLHLQLLQAIPLRRVGRATDDCRVLGVRQGGIEERPVVDARATAAGKVARLGELVIPAEFMHNPPGDSGEVRDGFRAVHPPDVVRDACQLFVLGFAEGGHVVRSEL